MKMLCGLMLLLQAAAGSDALARLEVLDGRWSVKAQHAMAGEGKTDDLRNRCMRGEAFFVCEQVVNGHPGALVVYVAGEKPGEYHTKVVLPGGKSSELGDLTIEGDHWTYLGKNTEADKTTWFRTENWFKGRDGIRFELWTSGDGKSWTKTNEGEEVRVK
jgi:hypothetical protein